MDLATLLRRVKRQFGDEYNIIINDQDIFDWANEAQMQIIRDTTSNDVTVSRVANTFPVGISDRVRLKRVMVNNKVLTHTTLSELDLTDIDSTNTGTPLYWYYTGGNLHLWPTPTPSDTYNVVVTYSKVPTPLSLVAPYLEWQLNPPVPQLATIAADVEMDITTINMVIEMTVGANNQDFTVVSKSTDPTVAASHNFALFYDGQTTGPNNFRFTYSNGTEIRSAPLSFRPAETIINGEKIKFRVKYVPTTGVTTLHRFLSNGTEVLDDTETQATSLPFNISNTTGRATVFGGYATTARAATWKLHYFSYIDVLDSAIFTFDGSTDLTVLPVVPATPFTVFTNQTMAVTGNLQKLSEDNVFSVPEVYHDDIVKFCIARAHNKNRNYKGEENMMEEFNQAVNLRREEANTIDAPTYKGADPFDYGWDYDASYG